MWVVVLMLAAPGAAAQDVGLPDLPAQEADQQQDPIPGPLPPVTQRPTPTAAARTKQLDLGLSLFEAFDRTTADDVLRVVSPTIPVSDQTSFAGANASLTYLQTSRDSTFSAMGGASLRYGSGLYFSGTDTVSSVDSYGALNFSKRLNPRISVRGNVGSSFSPYYMFGYAPPTGDLATVGLPQVTVPQFNQAVNRVNTITTNTSAGLTWTLSQRSSISLGASLDYTDTQLSGYRSRYGGANGSYGYRTSKYLTVRAGYGFYRTEIFGQPIPSYDTHNIDGGIDYRRPLSFSRRSVLGFNFGTTLITDGQARAFYVTGDASLTHQLSQFWSAAFSYARNVSRSGPVSTPFVNDIVGAGVTGLVTRHFGLGGSVGYTRGNTAVVASNAYDAVYTSGRVTYELARYLPLYTEYIYYFYKFTEPAGVAAGFPLTMNRNGLRFGLVYSKPLVGQRPIRR